MENSPKNRPSLRVLLGSLVRWCAGVIALLAYVFSFAFLTLFVHHAKIDFILKGFAKTMTWIAGIRVRATGLDRIDPKTPYVFVFNHTNIFDHFVIYSVLPHIARGVEREDHFRWPVHGLFLRRIGQVPIPPRGDTARAIQALEKAKALFRSGISVAIAPEGTRSPTGELLPFKKGAFHMALDLEAPIAPIVLRGMADFNRKGSWILRPGTVDVEFLDPISTRGLSRQSLGALRDDVRALFVHRLESNNHP